MHRWLFCCDCSTAQVYKQRTFARLMDRGLWSVAATFAGAKCARSGCLQAMFHNHVSLMHFFVLKPCYCQTLNPVETCSKLAAANGVVLCLWAHVQELTLVCTRLWRAWISRHQRHLPCIRNYNWHARAGNDTEMQEALVRMAALHDLQQADILRAQVKAVTFLGVQVV